MAVKKQTVAGHGPRLSVSGPLSRLKAAHLKEGGGLELGGGQASFLKQYQNF
jgi:hypothetical protein